MGFLAVGLLAGILSGFFGIGGGLVIVPALMMIWHMQPQAATGTSLGALLLPVGLLGAWQYYRNGLVNVPAAGFIALGLLDRRPARRDDCLATSTAIRSASICRVPDLRRRPTLVDKLATNLRREE